MLENVFSCNDKHIMKQMLPIYLFLVLVLVLILHILLSLVLISSSSTITSSSSITIYHYPTYYYYYYYYLTGNPIVFLNYWEISLFFVLKIHIYFSSFNSCTNCSDILKINVKFISLLFVSVAICFYIQFKISNVNVFVQLSTVE